MRKTRASRGAEAPDDEDNRRSAGDADRRGSAGDQDNRRRDGAVTTTTGEDQPKQDSRKSKRKHLRLKQKKPRDARKGLHGLGKAVVVIGCAVAVIAVISAVLPTDEIRDYSLRRLSKSRRVRRVFDKLKADDRFRSAATDLETFLGEHQTSDDDGSQKRPGLRLANTREASMPIVVFPGITSSMLELWRTRPCAQAEFRDRVWGSMENLKFAFNANCWLEHLGLDPETWDDPEGIKVRPLEGMSAMDYMFPGYFVWGKIFVNLADVGYDSRTLKVYPYDWRLTPQHLQERDGLFSRVMNDIEFMVARSGERCAVISHSMGGQYSLYFFNFVAARRGSDWLTKHIGGWLNLAGPLLGVIKSTTSVISGETRDTVDIGRIAGPLTKGELNVGLANFFRSLGALSSMLPKGDDLVWNHRQGDGIHFPYDVKARLEKALSDETDEQVKELSGRLLDVVSQNYTTAESTKLLHKFSPGYMKLVEKYYDLGDKISNPKDPRAWTNPMSAPLPFVDRSTKIYCMYGYVNQTGTEYGYLYDLNKRHKQHVTSLPFLLEDSKEGIFYRPEGDGTVALLSLAFPCLGLWKQKGKYNPYGVKCITREYMNDPLPEWYEVLRTGLKEMPRGGPKASSHIELLGNYEMLEDMLMIVTRPKDGKKFELKEKIYSPALSLIDEINEKRKKRN